LAYQDLFRLSSHAVITDDDGHILLLKAAYGEFEWGLPGGALDPGETIHTALERECMEELGCTVTAHYLSGVYFHAAHNSHAFIFRCSLKSNACISLSAEHSAFKYSPLGELSAVQRQRVGDCLNYQGQTLSAKF